MYNSARQRCQEIQTRLRGLLTQGLVIFHNSQCFKHLDKNAALHITAIGMCGRSGTLLAYYVGQLVLVAEKF